MLIAGEDDDTTIADDAGVALEEGTDDERALQGLRLGKALEI